MRLSSMADYAVVTMVTAARHGRSAASNGAGAARNGWVSAAELARDSGLPTATVQKLVSKLTAAGLLRSVRGAGGGLALARPAAAISLAEIVEAVEGPIALTACVEHGRHDCGLEACCTVRPHWGAVNAALRGALASVNLATLSSPPVSSGGAARGHRLPSLETNGA